LDEHQTSSSCATADTLSAAENFDNFTWWNLQLQFPVDLDVNGGGISYSNIGAANKEMGLVQAVDYIDNDEAEELVILNWTIADTPRSFVLQWIYNDGIVWNSHEFCKDRPGRKQRGDSSSTDSCLDRYTGGYTFGTCYHERDGMTWGSPIRLAEFVITVDCCPSPSSSSAVPQSTMTTASALVDRLLVGAFLLLGLCSILLVKSRTWVNHSKEEEEEEDRDYDPNDNGGGSGGWTSLIMASSSGNVATAAEANKEEEPISSSSRNKIKTTQVGLTTVRAWQ
jgi:hypothetical protein